MFCKLSAFPKHLPSLRLALPGNLPSFPCPKALDDFTLLLHKVFVLNWELGSKWSICLGTGGSCLTQRANQIFCLSPEEYDLSELIRCWAGVRNLRKGRAGDVFAQVFPTGGEVGGSREVLGWVKQRRDGL